MPGNDPKNNPKNEIKINKANSSSTYTLKQDDDEFISIKRNGGADPSYSLMVLEAPSNPLNRESTYSNVSVDPNNPSDNVAIDWYLNDYPNDAQMGIRSFARGNRSHLPFVFEYHDGRQQLVVGVYITAGNPVIPFDPQTFATLTPQIGDTVTMNVTATQPGIIPYNSKIIAVDLVARTITIDKPPTGTETTGTKSIKVKRLLEAYRIDPITRIF
jgi:hypothetical protein